MLDHITIYHDTPAAASEETQGSGNTETTALCTGYGGTNKMFRLEQAGS